jgi:hypothetical protein
VLDTGVPAIGMTFRERAAVEHRIWEYSAHPMRDADGSIRGVVCYTVEMTKQVATEQERARGVADLRLRAR